MKRSFLIIAGCVMATVPAVHAQVGLASSVQTIALSATKHGEVGIALSDSARLAVPAFAMKWNVDPGQTGSVSLAAYTGNTNARTRLFTQPISAGNARGDRKDQVEVGADSTGLLTLRVITQ